MRRETRDEAIRRANHESERAARLARMLDDVLGGRVSATERAKGDAPGTSYTYRLIRPTGCDGGLVGVTFHARGQNPTTDIVPLDDLRNAFASAQAGVTPEMHAALDRLMVARQRALGGR